MLSWLVSNSWPPMILPPQPLFYKYKINKRKTKGKKEQEVPRAVRELPPPQNTQKEGFPRGFQGRGPLPAQKLLL